MHAHSIYTGVCRVSIVGVKDDIDNTEWSRRLVCDRESLKLSRVRLIGETTEESTDRTDASVLTTEIRIIETLNKLERRQTEGEREGG